MATVACCNVLLVDDDPGIGALVRAVLGDEGYSVCVARTGDCALDIVRRDSPDLMLLDVLGPDRDLDRLVAGARELRPGIQIVLFTALSEAEATAIQAALPDVGLLRKPFELDDLVATVRRAVAGESAE